MLTDVIVEEEFDRKDEEEMWYSRKDLEHEPWCKVKEACPCAASFNGYRHILETDLHLAAQLGKTLLDRNHELEQSLQQMTCTNHEQQLEVQYLSRQLELLRQMNEQHAKLYEQLDVAARELERSNQQLVQENRSAHHSIQRSPPLFLSPPHSLLFPFDLPSLHIHSLTETIEGLQTHMEALQKQLEELKVSQCRRDLATLRRGSGAQSMSCLKEIHDLQKDGCWRSENLRGERSCPALTDPPEEESSALQQTLLQLKQQLASEHARRVEVEQQSHVTQQQYSALEECLFELERARGRQAELQNEVEELRLLWRSETTTAPVVLMPDSVFYGVELRAGVRMWEEPEVEELQLAESKGEEGLRSQSEVEEKLVQDLPQGRQRSSSDGHVRRVLPEGFQCGHDQTCIRRPRAVQQRGISLLMEVDAQYSALQLKYQELLERCQPGPHSLSHKAVQTPHTPNACAADTTCTPEPIHQPEYKALFQEIFNAIQKTKEDLSENRLSQDQ
ncbi:hypothetical protein DNTS_013047 [Danionella cerebrum]|uniref:Uncharacterized protein n=1 Tax=Danionella cerebrum TaxID=2873325 RepID=A0A553RET4_9TELE|nr:hypothetical protein DNTS_013047 [Danionella translucida]TRZ00699.1 hypothetical protein DNTS_013047 [Danionella translucida]